MLVEAGLSILTRKSWLIVLPGLVAQVVVMVAVMVVLLNGAFLGCCLRSQSHSLNPHQQSINRKKNRET